VGAAGYRRMISDDRRTYLDRELPVREYFPVKNCHGSIEGAGMAIRLRVKLVQEGIRHITASAVAAKIVLVWL